MDDLLSMLNKVYSYSPNDFMGIEESSNITKVMWDLFSVREAIMEVESQTKWDVLVETFKDALNEYHEAERVWPIIRIEEAVVTLSSYLGDKGWRSRAFYKGNVFEVRSARVAKKGGMLLSLLPEFIPDQLRDEGFEHAEIDIKKGEAIFGESFLMMWQHVMGMTFKQSLEAIRKDHSPKRKLLPEPPAPEPELETQEGWGDW